MIFDMGILVVIKTEPAAKLLAWQWYDECHYVSFLMFVTGAKFEEYCFNISRVILDGVLCCFSGTTYDIITFLICNIQKRV